MKPSYLDDIGFPHCIALCLLLFCWFPAPHLAEDLAVAPEPVALSRTDHLEPDVASLIADRLAKARQAPDQAAAHGDLALAYEANLLWQEAQASYALAVQLDPQNLDWRFHHALATRQAGDFEASVELFRELAEDAPDFPPVQQRLGHAQLERGELEAAASSFDQLVRLLPQDASGYVGRGDVLLRQRRYPEAAAELETAVQIAPGYRSAQYLLGTAYLRLGRKEEAKRALNRGVDATLAYLESPLAPKVDEYAVNVTARLSRAGRLLGSGRPEEAIELLETARLSHPHNISLLNNLAIAYMRLNRLDRAAKLLFEAREIDPEKFSTYLNLVSWAMRQRDLEQAYTFASLAVAKAPEMARTYYSRAQVLAYQSRFEEALNDLTQSLLRDHQNPGAHTFSGDLCIRLERFDSARQHYRDALEVDDEFLPAYLGLGKASQALGDTKSAEQALEQARGLAPEHPLVKRLEEQLALPGGSG